MKRCRECGAEKPRTAFQARKGANDGLRSECRDCNLQRQRDYGERVRKARRLRDRERYAERREAIIEQRREERARDGVEINARRRELRKLDPERFRKQKREYLANNPQKYAAHVLRVSERHRSTRRLDEATIEFVQLVRRDPCSYCGESAEAWDHIEPHAKGGASIWENATGACTRCNASKKDENLLLFLLRAPL